MRQLRIRMSDDTIRSVMVDENQPVANLMVIICTKLGITNHDEYSLIATGKHTINGRRKERLNDGRIIDLKMEQLKKKLKTDEDLAWVDHSKTLDEQEIHEQDIVLLRRKFFYSDQNIDSKDPIQLGLLYVQTRDAILSGTHPVTLDGACKFAGLQCQAQFGDFIEGKTNRSNNYINNLKDFLPFDYSKQKHIEKKIFNEHKKFIGLNDIEAKAKYVNEARSLPTYGVTFFLVKEKVQGKNKLIPRLLGITKDCVMRVDADSKAILKTWPLTTVKRWAASMNSFTLDFGDYSDSYYSVQTSEGEQISQLIAGYIDIILKRRKAKDHFGIEGDEGATMVEDSVAPSRATIIQNSNRTINQPAGAAINQEEIIDLASIPGPTVQKKLFEEGPMVEPPVYRPAVEVRGKAEIGYESRPLTQYVTNYELTLPQRDLQDRLEHAQDAVEEAQRVLDKSHQVTSSFSKQQQQQRQQQQSGTNNNNNSSRLEVEQKKRKLSNQFAEINAATAELVSLSAIPEEELNYPALNNAVETVTKSLPIVAKDVKIVASLMEDEDAGERLIDAARKLCKAFSDLLNAAEPGPTVPRQSLISAASRVGDATQALLCSINNDDGDGDYNNELNDNDRNEADNLLGLAKSVASSAASLVLKAKDIAKTCQDEELKNRVISLATQCALATSQMVATAKIVAPTIYDQNCQRKLIDSCREVQRSVDGIQLACRDAIRDEQLMCKLNDSVTRVNYALDELIDHVRSIKQQQQQHSNRQRQQQQQQTNKTTTTTTTKTSTTQLHKIHDESSGRTIEQQHSDRPREKEEESELVNQARTLARATAKLIQDIRPEVSPNSSSGGGGGHHHHHHQTQQQQPSTSSYSSTSHHHHQNVYNNNDINRYDHHNYDDSRYNNNNQQRQQQQQTTTTITTTVYDEEEHRRDQQQHERPVSMYDSESGSQRFLSGLGDPNLFRQPPPPQQQQTTTSTTSYHHEEQQQQQQQHQDNNSQQSAEATISGIVGDLETTIMFATSGTLRSSSSLQATSGDDNNLSTINDNYQFHRENVLRCAKALVEDTRPLVASSATNEQQLAKVAQDSVYTMSRLAETVKASAASLGPNNSESQVNLIRSVKDVACSLSDLIGSTKSALGCENSNDPRLLNVKDSAKTMVTSVTSLLKTVKSVEDEQQRGIRAIETALESIEQDLSDFQAFVSSGSGGGGNIIFSDDPTQQRQQLLQAPDELIRTSRHITMATAKTVHAGSSGQQDDAIVAANMGQKAVRDLLQATKLASLASNDSVTTTTTTSYEMRQRVQEAGRSCSISCKQLIEQLHRIFQHPSIASANPEIKQELIQQSKIIANNVQELIQCGEYLKSNIIQQQQHESTSRDWQQSSLIGGGGGGGGGSDNFNNNNNNNNNDPTVIAESELLGAASSIDAAARKLENLKPRVTSVKLPHDDLNFDEIILDAAKSIIEATAALLRAASASQRELIVDGRLDETETFYASDNNQWSEGLISAARMVAAATHSLVEAANSLVQGQASEERLISAAKQVASSTNQLLVACKVKADPDSRTMARLSNAGNQVKRATDNLVRAAQQAIENDEEQSLIISNKKVSGIAQEISAREQILRKEKELHVAKTQLMAIRKAKYSNRPDDYQGYGGSLD